VVPKNNNLNVKKEREINSEEKERREMRKIGLLAVVMGLVLALALPALAFTIEGGKGEKMYIGGQFLTDFMWWSRSKELTGTNTDQTQFIVAVPTNSRLRGSLEIGNVGGFWEFGMGGSEAGTSGAGSGATNNYVDTRKLYGWYKFGNAEIRTGKDDGYFITFTMPQYLGQNDGRHSAGKGWGAVEDYRDPQFRFTQNISKEFGYMITLLQPVVFTDSTRVSYNQFPRAALKVMLDFGMFKLYPAFIYQAAKWDNLNQTATWAGKSVDDMMYSWNAILPARITAGPFVATAQFGYGQNLGTFIDYQSTYHLYFRDAGGRIKDTTGMNGFIDLAYTIGPATPHVYFGYDNAKNSDAYKGPKGDDYNTRMMYGISMPIKIADGFFISPEFDYYDYGKFPAGTGANAGKDIGKEWLGGIQFQFIF
jgi:hypothetical protein